MTDELPGGYDTVEGIKKRCMALGAPHFTALMEDIEDRVVEKGDGYIVENPPEDADEDVFKAHLFALYGAALEREYPADVGGEE